MLRDIPIREVTEVGLALIPEKDIEVGELWVAHIVNLKDHALKNILINVKGGGEVDGSTKKTANVRYSIDEIGPLSSHKIEVLLPEVLTVANQFWISFSLDNYLYDKKFVVPDDAREVMELVGIPVLHCQGLWFD
jgi:hypothetical protein